MNWMLLIGTESREAEDKAEAFALGTAAAVDNPRKAVSVHGDGKVWRYVGPGKGDKVGLDRSAWKCEAP